MMARILGRLLCMIGLHAFEVQEATIGFGSAGGVAKVRCRRCGLITTRRT